MVVHESDILTNDGAGLITALGSYIDMFEEFTKKEDYMKALMVLISCGEPVNMSKIYKIFKKLIM